MAQKPYHHGDLRAALVDAGLAITRKGGPSALGIRDVTRRVGVSPNAAYRHFADRGALLAAVSSAIQDRVADQMDIERPRGGTRQSRALARLRSVGEGYIEFGLAEPGWFAVAFFGAGPALADAGADQPPLPYVELQEALDGLLEAEVITPEQRAGAEWPCWATVHGFVELAMHGPLRDRSADELRALGSQAVGTIISGLDTT